MFLRVFQSSELPEGSRRVFENGQQQVLILRTSGGLFAIDNLCPHRAGLFSEGELENHHIFCPLHAWCFDVRTGDGFYPKGVSVNVYPVREVEGWVELNLATPLNTP